MKTYVVMVSKNFPVGHPMVGHMTHFPEKIENKTKKHTIRGNYELWRKRFEQINKGLACLSVRVWNGKPYRSKQFEIQRYFNTDGIGVEKLEMTLLGWFVNDVESDVRTWELAMYDGLSLRDFNDWFKGKVSVEMDPMAIIHFTKFRYGKYGKR